MIEGAELQAAARAQQLPLVEDPQNLWRPRWSTWTGAQLPDKAARLSWCLPTGQVELLLLGGWGPGGQPGEGLLKVAF